MPGHVLQICEGKCNIHQTARHPCAQIWVPARETQSMWPYEQWAGLCGTGKVSVDLSPTLYQHKYLLQLQHSPPPPDN